MLMNGANEGYTVRRAISSTYRKMLLNPSYKYLVLLLGAPVNLIVFIVYLLQQQGSTYSSLKKDIQNEWLASGLENRIREEIEEQERRKYQFFGHQINEEQFQKQVDTILQSKLQIIMAEEIRGRMKETEVKESTFIGTFTKLMNQQWFLWITLIPGFLMYLIIFLYSYPYLKFILERLVMTFFVIIGVSILVFTILYLSPFNPAANILGESATEEQIAAFNKVYGLDQPYLIQLWHTLQGILTFDLGESFTGNEDVMSAIARKFPITLTIALISLLMAIVIALPIGIISATRPNSIFDNAFMFIALLGLSIPSFWQGLIFILNFSIKLEWLPATYNSANWLSIIMPTVVLGTTLAASVARMTRSSTLDVINEDYVLTARAKGMSKRRVLLRHAVPNALIPIVTVIGLQFGGMLGGAAVTEKVFNISGLGSYIVDKQYIPDIPSVMGAVIYTAIVISLINMIIDILYALIDPRIKSKMKQY